MSGFAEKNCFYLDKTTGDVLTEPTETQTPNETGIVWASQEKLYEIDWFGVWYELKNWELPWRCMKISDFLKSHFITLVPFFTCIYVY